MNETLNFYEKYWEVVRGYGGRGGWILGRVPDVRFSKCSGLGDGGLTQPLEPTKPATGSFCWPHWRIHHPWLKSRSRQRPVAELLGNVQSIKKI